MLISEKVFAGVFLSQRLICLLPFRYDIAAYTANRRHFFAGGRRIVGRNEHKQPGILDCQLSDPLRQLTQPTNRAANCLTEPHKSGDKSPDTSEHGEQLRTGQKAKQDGKRIFPAAQVILELQKLIA